MAYVLLILGLIAAGIYTENSWFYIFAGIAGFFWFITVILIASLTATAKKAFQDNRVSFDQDVARIRARRGTRR